MKVFAKIAYGLAWWKFPVRGQERGGCVCGGDMCVCGFCQGDIGRLRAGVRSGKLLHTVCDIRSWSSEDGMVIAEESA